MNNPQCVAANRPAHERKGLAILALAGPDLAQRRALFDLIVAELSQREHLDSARIRPLRWALENQRDVLLAFAGVLDAKLGILAPLHAVGSLSEWAKARRNY